jgi:hypothetical protein
MPSLSVFINHDARLTEVRQRSIKTEEILFATELVPSPRDGRAGACATTGSRARSTS